MNVWEEYKKQKKRREVHKHQFVDTHAPQFKRELREAGATEEEVEDVMMVLWCVNVEFKNAEEALLEIRKRWGKK